MRAFMALNEALKLLNISGRSFWNLSQKSKYILKPVFILSKVLYYHVTKKVYSTKLWTNLIYIYHGKVKTRNHLKNKINIMCLPYKT